MKQNGTNISPITFLWIGMLVTGFLLVISAIFIQSFDQKQVDEQSLTLLMEEQLKEQIEGSNELVSSTDTIVKEQDGSKLNTTVVLEQSSNVILEVDATDASAISNNNNVEAAIAPQSNKIDINTATSSQLQQLKGIGPAKASAIIADREQKGKYKNIADIKRVKGIGEKLYAGIQESIVAEP